MDMKITTMMRSIFTILSPLSTDHLLVNQPPSVCPDAKVKPISQSSLPFNPKSIKAAVVYTTITTALMTLDFINVR